MQSSGKTTVLVVEDDILVRMYGVDILEDAGFIVLEAESADEALILLQQHDDVQLLFSDIDMPGSMNGVELAREVHSRWPTIPCSLRLAITISRKTGYPIAVASFASPGPRNG